MQRNSWHKIRKPERADDREHGEGPRRTAQTTEQRCKPSPESVHTCRKWKKYGIVAIPGGRVTIPDGIFQFQAVLSQFWMVARNSERSCRKTRRNFPILAGIVAFPGGSLQIQPVWSNSSRYGAVPGGMEQFWMVWGSSGWYGAVPGGSLQFQMVWSSSGWYRAVPGGSFQFQPVWAKSKPGGLAGFWER